MLPFRLVYDDRYDLHLGDHVFPSRKYRWLHDRLLADGFATPEDFESPAPATDEDVLLVHHPVWVRKLRTGTLTYQEILALEIPYSRHMVEACWLAAGGSIHAGRLALRDGIGFNLGGGLHHGFVAHGEGFCAINDVAVAVRRLLRDGTIARAMVVDADVHHGNGTAAIFAGDPNVFTFSIHQFNNYPEEKPPSCLDIHLADGVGDAEYVHRLAEGLRGALGIFHPDLIFYLAGADPYQDDQLGGLSLTFEGLHDRDRLVFWTALSHGIPVAVTLAGGYANNQQDTVTIHANTAHAAREVIEKTGWKGK